MEAREAIRFRRVVAGADLAKDAADLAEAAHKVGVLLAAHDVLGAEADDAPVEPEQAQEVDELGGVGDGGQVAAVDDRADGRAQRLELEVEARDGDRLVGQRPRHLLRHERRVLGMEEVGERVGARVLLRVVHSARRGDGPKARAVGSPALDLHVAGIEDGALLLLLGLLRRRRAAVGGHRAGFFCSRLLFLP